MATTIPDPRAGIDAPAVEPGDDLTPLTCLARSVVGTGTCVRSKVVGRAAFAALAASPATWTVALGGPIAVGLVGSGVAAGGLWWVAGRLARRPR